MFMKSAANDTLQGKAIQAINVRWGEDSRNWSGRETIGIPVCKKKYAPFSFKVERDSNGRAKVTVERMFGCHCHSNITEEIDSKTRMQNGLGALRPMESERGRKEMAKHQTERINAEEGITSDEGWSGEEEGGKGVTPLQ
jgi:hypothetical protein